MKARGNAPGKSAMDIEALKGRKPMTAPDYALLLETSPFQGFETSLRLTRGVAPGFHIPRRWR